MSFLMHAFMKLVLKRRITQFDYRQTTVNQQKYNVTKQIGAIEQAIASARNVANTLASSSSMLISQGYMKKYEGKELTTADQQKISLEIQAAQFAAVQTNNAINSVFDTAARAKLDPLKAMDDQYEQELASITSQRQLCTAELKAQEEGEKDAAKSTASSFVG